MGQFIVWRIAVCSAPVEFVKSEICYALFQDWTGAEEREINTFLSIINFSWDKFTGSYMVYYSTKFEFD